ncbi:hypothetical protein GYMLUDRAFT_71248 [Collybiopsis luxurians FD-317 M1]|nr:hypothetical protein GYMLUDRAFT_71248 [Collybiopsis luxurians FD-317 M1]
MSKASEDHVASDDPLLNEPQNTDYLPPTLKPGDSAVMTFSWIPDSGQHNSDFELRLLRDCGGMYGIPEHFSSVRHHEKGCPTTNHLFLPSPSENLDDFRWNLFDEPTEKPDYRSLWRRMDAFPGHSLVSAKDLLSLIRAVLDAHLGYYNMCQKNYQHRNLSIENVLMVDEAIQSKPFDIPDPKDEVQEEILHVCKELNIDDYCTGFVVVDGVMAVDWNTYFSDERGDTESGTPEFISTAPLTPGLERHMHSPLDDYYSFFFVTQSACVFHDLSPEDSPEHPDFLENLRDRIAGDVKMIAAATCTITRRVSMEVAHYGAFLVQAQSFLREWYHSLQKLQTEWNEMVASQGCNIDSFRSIADRGLLSFLKVASKHISR